MSTVDSSAAVSGELGRHEAQRQALGSLLARFTADRDAMIASIQGCEERIAALAERLDNGAAAAPGAQGDAAGSGSEAPEGDARNAPTFMDLVEELRQEQQKSAEELKAAAVHATERADEALRRLEKPGQDGEELSRIRAEVAALRNSVDQLAGGLGQLRQATEERVESMARSSAMVGERVETMAGEIEKVRRLEEELENARGAVDGLADTLRKRPALVEASAQVQSAALDDLREQMAALKTAALCATGLRTVWLTLIVAILVTVIGFAAVSLG